MGSAKGATQNVCQNAAVKGTHPWAGSSEPADESHEGGLSLNFSNVAICLEDVRPDMGCKIHGSKLGIAKATPPAKGVTVSLFAIKLAARSMTQVKGKLSLNAVD